MSSMLQSRFVIWLGAFSGFYRPDVQEVRRLDQVSRFLFAARSVILVISAQAAIIAGLLAITDRHFALLPFVLVFIGFVSAHMISNLSNDYFGYLRGHDTPDSPRMRYTVHPLAPGVLSRKALVIGIAVLGAIGLGIAAFFIAYRGWPAVAFFVAGTALLFLYDAAPVPLKSIGLGEAAVMIVWGPLMVGGGYAMITGDVAANAMLASLPYGLGVMSILIGKHIDQAAFDASRGIRTLPVLIGDRAARVLNIITIVAIYAAVALLIASGRLSPFAAVVLVAFPSGWRALSLLRQPRPAQPPEHYVGWPLWYHRACLVHERRFGWAYIGGLACGALWTALPT